MPGRDGRKAEDADESALPPDVLAELVDGLFGPNVSFVVGAICCLAIGTTIAVRTESAWPTAVTALLAVMVAGRGVLAIAYRRRDRAAAPATATVRRWERRYAIGAMTFGAALGALCVAVFLATDDTLCHLLANGVATGYTAGVTARNSARPRIAIAQLALVLLPIAVAAALLGGPLYWLLAGVTVLYFVATVEIVLFLGNRHRRLLLATRETSRLAASLAAQNLRFDAALGNMSHGLCMFDRAGRLAVCNARLCEIYRVPPGTFTPGMTVLDMIEASAAAGNHPQIDPVEMAAEYERRLGAGAPSQSTMALGPDRTILLSQWPIADGGAVVLFEDITERERAEARAQWLATHDDLTGLPNRTKFSATLEAAIRTAEHEGRRFAVMFLDLDRFKFVNDTLGHAAGDRLLGVIAGRLAGCVEEGDVVSRLGGDEFVILLRDTGDAAGAGAVARRILSTVVEPVVVQGQECRVAASIGVAFFPDDGADEQTLTRNADAAMYLAKDEGRNCVRFFSPVIEARSIERLMMETSLRGALERNELVLHYQPKKDLATGEVSGVEALLRWNHPALGLLLPGRFVPLAEDTGLIVPIGRFVLHAACAQGMAWQRRGLPPVTIAVNLSPRQFADENLLVDIEEALAWSGFPPGLLELEITESMVMQNIGRAVDLLTAVREMGIRLAIDDFGTGYASMALIKQMPIDTIKIDRTFLSDVPADPEARAITDAIIALGKALDLTIVGEGVELSAQEDFLRERGCDEMQGFLFSRPLPADALAVFLAEHHARADRPAAGAAASADRDAAPPRCAVA
ncbi:diguanylate cyclase/phosphodiesterase (GGDEF & EAL domains) with PAS/PAC sensor(s) [Rhodovulum sp. PH10]|uniref:putative bifunctional diguanylate cyclase/phosphodiesterase n=1 Tax=Rhodovulum sp. PH10 TaxID=1187851 RepID=UPI00027C2BE6|nr:EAL domain-containing protein [Rhodovulum sp. PH10]EJW12428.1 diguanylate cyclase/phosphodiesterase (GGDEF & EAL domains) with PAS/PAC sensor(s) [Rhodovulum sp. PH10]